ncbi:MAG: hypothetical protein P8I31_05140, partial [Bacteroidia bacterium]|nr:hypothetical protein [Bacteroidia bacterium]
MIGGFDDIFFIVNKRDSQYFNHLKMIMNEKGISQNNLIIISDTNSQNETAFKGLNQIGKKLIGPIFFHNVDTFLVNRDFSSMKKSIQKNSGYIDVFSSNSHDYSYVISERGNVLQVAEKVLISEIASSGLYGFKDIDTYLKYYNPGYIINMFSSMISDGFSVVHGDVHDEKDTIVLGTPKEYFDNTQFIF